ncbi:hypothetical protein [Lysinibacillus fusiformis]|uniref:hypothetical protein n=1 Tax=Lysinibacillus fusiformis TaxID=28031 RepID=UPI003CED319E
MKGGYGTVTANYVRQGKTFGSPDGVKSGTLNLSQLIPGNIKNGVTIDGVTGNLVGSPTPSVGDAAVLAAVSRVTQYTSDYKKVREIICNFSGRVRVTFDLYGTGSGSGYENVYGQVYINGVAEGVVRTNNNSSGTFYSEDFDINNGDRVQLYTHGRTNPDTWASSDVFAICFASNPLGTVVQV